MNNASTNPAGFHFLPRRYRTPGIPGRWARAVLVCFLCWLIAFLPVPVWAADIVADSAADVTHRPGVDAAANGVTVVDIVAPNVAGLSHNKYNRFGVDASGAILNNSIETVSQSQLGGLLQGNSNLTDSGPASVILNEVTSSHRSLLAGALEVHGTRADVVVANPNGITCDGCGFINTPRATLSTGAPESGADGALAALRVEGGDISIGAGGADMAATDVFDLVAREIRVEGPVRAGGALNLVAGRNLYGYSTGLITPLAADGNEPAVAIDSSLLGGMYAGRITIVSTDNGAGVRMHGGMSATAEGMTLTADGDLALRNASAATAIDARSTSGAIDIDGALHAGVSVDLTAGTSLDLRDGAFVGSAGDLTLTADTVTLGDGALAASGTDAAGVQSATGVLTVDAATLLDAGRGQLAAGSKLDVTAATVDLSRDADTETSVLRSLGDLTVETDQITGTNARVAAQGDLIVHSANNLTLQKGIYSAGGALTAEGAALSSSAELEAAGILTLRALSGSVTNSGEASGTAGVTVAAAAGITNTGVINGGAGLTIRGTNLTNSGALGSADGPLDAELSGSLTNTGLLYSGTSSRFRLDGAFTNTEADILAETDLTVEGLTGARAGALVNSSGSIEAISGNLTLKAASVTNKRRVLVVEQTDTTATTTTGSPGCCGTSTKTTTTVTTDTVTEDSPAAQILAGDDIVVETGTLTNSYSQIAANGDITITADTATNVGRDLIETTVTKTWSEYCDESVLGVCLDWDWQVDTSTSTSATLGAVYGTIEANGTLTASVTGYLDNDAVRGGAGQIGLSSGDRVLAPPDGVFALPALDARIAALLEHSALFRFDPSLDAPYLIETRPEFIDSSLYLGSDYFLNRVGLTDPDRTMKRFGDAYVETRLVRDQVFELTGHRYLVGFTDARTQMRQLYDNAVDAQRDLDLTVGVALTWEQAAALTADIVWLERRTARDQAVLVPRLYLASATLDGIDLAGARIHGGETAIRAASLVNAGRISGEDALDIETTGALLNWGGSLVSGGDVEIDAGGRFTNLSGIVSGDDVRIFAADIVHDTAVTRDRDRNGFADRAHQTARIEARNDLELDAAGSIVSTGAEIDAGGDAVVRAGKDISFTALGIEQRRLIIFEGGYGRSASRTHRLALIRSGGDLTIEAGRDLTLRGAEVEAGGDADMSAGGAVEIASVQDWHEADMKLDIKGSGLFGADTNIRHQSSGTETRRTSITAGGSLTVRAGEGDLILDAARLESGGETRLEAAEGELAFLTETDTSFERHYERKESLFWWSEEDTGHHKETIEHVEIEAGGGLRIHAGDGVVVEYHKTGSLGAALDQLARSPGLSWIDQLRDDPTVDWRAVEAVFEEWDYEAQGLTEAGAALVSLVATIASAGTLSSFSAVLAQGLGFAAEGAIQMAIQAGLTSLTSQASVSLVNNQGDLGATLQQLGSSATLKSIAIAMITAGLTAELTDVAGIELPKNADAIDTIQTVEYRLQTGLIRASVDATARTAIEGGDLADAFVQGWTGALIRAGLAGAQHEIGDFGAESGGLLESAMPRILAHAVASGLAAELAGGEFGEGAGMTAFLQTFVEFADFYEQSTTYKADPLPGENRGKSTYAPDENHHQPVDSQGKNVTLYNDEELTGDFFEDFLKQQGPLSKVLNLIPGINATAGLHDYWTNKMSDQMGDDYSQVLNFGSIPPSVAITYAAIIGNYMQGWQDNPAYHAYLFNATTR